jgi:hypothetical protein
VFLFCDYALCVIFKNPLAHNHFVSGHRKEETPDPIPNSEVKLFHGDICTALWAGRYAAADTYIPLILSITLKGSVVLHSQAGFKI